MTDIEAESWVVGIERDNGMIGTITSESYINPKEISNVYIAVLSNGDENEFDIYMNHRLLKWQGGPDRWGQKYNILPLFRERSLIRENFG